MKPIIVAISLSMIVLCGPISAQDQIDTAFLLPKKHHAWGRFDVGAWKKVRVKTETLNEQGEVIGESVAETLTRLESVDARGFSLKSETTIMIGGRELGKQTTTLWQGFAGENADDQVSSRLVRPASVRIGSKAVDAEVREFVFRCNDMRRVSSIHYSPSVVPHVLQGETVATDAAGQTVKYKTSIDVVSLNHDLDILDEEHKVAKVATIHETPRAKVVTTELFSVKVPGGIVASESEEHDLSGKVISRSTLELVDYGMTSDPTPTAVFRGRFMRRRSQR